MKRISLYATLLVLIFGSAATVKSICSNPTFDTLSSLTVNRPLALAPADFNRDGKTDLAILRDSLSPNAGLVQIWLGDGASNFSWTGVDYPAVQTNVVGITAGEFNQDGILDLAVVGGPTSNFVVALLFGNGSGGFSAPTSFPIGSDPEDITTADFNNDGRTDIVTADFNGRVAAILPNTGSGNFGTAIAIPTGTTGGSNPAPIAIVTGKFNADNNQDFLTVNNDETVSVKLGNGNFTFNNPPTIPTNLVGIQQDIEIGDFNRDGIMDFATSSSSANASNNVVNIRAGTGTGLFTIPTNSPFPVTNSANHLAVTDFNGDGKSDIASANNGSSGSNNLSILLNTDNGNFSQAYTFTAEVGRSEKVYAIDFDRNRSPDLLVFKEVGDNKIVRLRNTCIFPQRFDYDFDGKADISIFRPSLGQWWINHSSNNTTFAATFGTSTDKIVPADYTGDGKADIAFWRPSTGEWFILRSENLSFFSFPFGTNGDIPAPADFDGDGKTDAAVFRPSTQTWFIRRSSDGGTTILGFGINGDKPVVSDYDGDGKSDIAIFRPSNGQWWIRNSSTLQVTALQFGSSTDRPIQGDYTGDGKADVGFFRPSTGEWFILRSENFSFYSFPFGTSGDNPAPGDYDGDGRMDAAVFRPSNNIWYISRSASGLLIVGFGSNGDQPVPGAFVP